MMTKMNEKQFDIIAKKLIKSALQREAVYQSVMYNLSPSEAEVYAYGRVTNTVGRDAKRVQAEYDFIQEVAIS